MIYKYDIALSFAGENRDYVEQVADLLRNADIKVFYDQFEQVDLWGKNLYTHLRKVYRDYAKYTVIFASEFYAKKQWTNHERESAQERAFEENREYILPARFDNTEIPGLSKTVGYINLTMTTPIEFCKLIVAKLGKPWLSNNATTQYPEHLLKEVTSLHELRLLVSMIEASLHSFVSLLNQFDDYLGIETIYHLLGPSCVDINTYHRHILKNIPAALTGSRETMGDCRKLNAQNLSLEDTYGYTKNLIWQHDNCYFIAHRSYWLTGKQRINLMKKLPAQIKKTLLIIPKVRKFLEFSMDTLSKNNSTRANSAAAKNRAAD